MFFRGVMTPSLMPAGPDAQHMLDPSSMSVVIVIVFLTLRIVDTNCPNRRIVCCSLGTVDTNCPTRSPDCLLFVGSNCSTVHLWACCCKKGPHTELPLMLFVGLTLELLHQLPLP